MNPNSLLGIAVAALNNKRLGADNPILQHARGAQQLDDWVRERIEAEETRKRRTLATIAELEVKVAESDAAIGALGAVRHRLAEVDIAVPDNNGHTDLMREPV